ncbi:MAG: hypothetical protein WC620_09340 [Methanoregula sp.]
MYSWILVLPYACRSIVLCVISLISGENRCKSTIISSSQAIRRMNVDAAGNGIAGNE